METKKFYRYQERVVTSMSYDMNGEPTIPTYSLPTVDLQEDIFYLFSETKKGYWLSLSLNDSFLNFSMEKYRWVSKTSKKRFAYPTKLEALENFIHRKNKHIQLISHRLYIAKVARDIAFKLKEEINGSN